MTNSLFNEVHGPEKLGEVRNCYLNAEKANSDNDVFNRSFHGACHWIASRFISRSAFGCHDLFLLNGVNQA